MLDWRIACIQVMFLDGAMVQWCDGAMVRWCDVVCASSILFPSRKYWQTVF